MVKFDIIPNKSVGPFELGLTISDTIQVLQELFPTTPCKIVYSDEGASDQQLILQVPNLGLQLRYESTHQRCILIDFFDFSVCELSYRQRQLCGSGQPPTCLRVYKMFGPTFAGQLVGSGQYVLGYQGAAFSFHIPKKYQDIYQTSDDVPLELPNGSTPVLTRMWIFIGDDVLKPKLPQALPLPTNSPSMEALDDEYVVVVNYIADDDRLLATKRVLCGNESFTVNHLPSFTVHFPSVSQSKPGIGSELTEGFLTVKRPIERTLSSKRSLQRSASANSISDSTAGATLIENSAVSRGAALHFRTHEDKQADAGPSIAQGDAHQVVLSVLGPPSGVHTKASEHMRIHRSAAYDSHEQQQGRQVAETEPGIGANIPYFVNYFRWGCDFLIDHSQHAVAKLILHTNQVGHAEFNEYRRSHARVVYNVWKREQTDDDSEDAATALQLRQSVSFQTTDVWKDVETKLGSAGRPMVRGESASVNPFAHTLLYAYPHLVFEVMKSGAIASITIF